MWPILIVSIVSLFVVIDRCILVGLPLRFAAIRNGSRRSSLRLRAGDLNEASRLARDTRDPVLRMLWNGLNHRTRRSRARCRLQPASRSNVRAITSL